MSKRYDLAEDLVYGKLAIGQIESVEDMLNALPELELDPERLMAVANNLLSDEVNETRFGGSTLDIIAAVYIAEELAGRELDPSKVVEVLI